MIIKKKDPPLSVDLFIWQDSFIIETWHYQTQQGSSQFLGSKLKIFADFCNFFQLNDYLFIYYSFAVSTMLYKLNKKLAKLVLSGYIQSLKWHFFNLLSVVLII